MRLSRAVAVAILLVPWCSTIEAQGLPIPPDSAVMYRAAEDARRAAEESSLRWLDVGAIASGIALGAAATPSISGRRALAGAGIGGAIAMSIAIGRKPAMPLMHDGTDGADSTTYRRAFADEYSRRIRRRRFVVGVRDVLVGVLVGSVITHTLVVLSSGDAIN